MEKVIQYRVKSVYGNEMIYPANLNAEIITKLTGKKTLSLVDLQYARSLGFTTTQVM